MKLSIPALIACLQVSVLPQPVLGTLRTSSCSANSPSLQNECFYSFECKNMYPTATDCKNSEGGVCFCGDDSNKVCGCLGPAICSVQDLKQECSYTRKCKNMYPRATDCANWLGGVCLCGDKIICGCPPPPSWKQIGDDIDGEATGDGAGSSVAMSVDM